MNSTPESPLIGTKYGRENCHNPLEQNRILQIQHFTALKILQSSPIKSILNLSKTIESIRGFCNFLFSLFDKPTFINSLFSVIFHIVAFLISMIIVQPLLFILKFKLLYFFHKGLTKVEQLAMYDSLNSFGFYNSHTPEIIERLRSDSENFWQLLHKKKGADAFNAFVYCLASARRNNDRQEQLILDNKAKDHQESIKKNIEQKFDDINAIEATKSLFEKLK